MNRKYIVFLAVCILLFFSACSKSENAGNEKTSSTEFFAMDTYVSFTAYGSQAEEANHIAQERIQELETMWSVTDKESEIYQVNHSGGKPVSIGSETVEILSFALQMAEKTKGALEPTIYPVLTAWGFTTDENRIPSRTELKQLLQNVGYKKVIFRGNKVQLPEGMQLDFGAVGKGYAGDEAVKVLKEKGITSALLDIGGNIQVIGSKPDGTDWRLGLRNPFDEGNLGVLQIHDLAVVTSGSYERYFIGDDGKCYGHIMNPVTGYPAENGLASVTVIAKEGKLCDALSTSLYVMGLDGAVEYWRQHLGFELIMITEDGEIYLTEGIQEKFTLNDSYSSMKVNVLSSKETEN